MPATNAAMNPDPSSPLDPVGEGGARGRNHLTPPVGDQAPAAELGDDPRDERAGEHAADRAVADLLEHELDCATPAGDVRLDIRQRDRGEQQRHADAVVQPAFDVEALADSRNDARIGDDCLSERGIRRRQDHADDHGLAEGQLIEDDGRDERSERNGERKAESEQTSGQADAGAQRPEIDPRGVAEEHESQRRLGQRPHEGAGAREIDAAQHLRTDDESDCDEQHRGGDRRPGQTPRDRGNSEQRERRDCERPMHQARDRGRWAGVGKAAARGSAAFPQPVIAATPMCRHAPEARFRGVGRQRR
jgi:hypothetical protein